MSPLRPHVHRAGGVSVVCPVCRKTLAFQADDIFCTSCGAKFQYEAGFPDLIVGERFGDSDDPELADYEAKSNAYLVENYFKPTFAKVLSGLPAPRILSLGCGVGIDVDLLGAHGLETYGVDCGNRTKDWPKRQLQSRLYLANGKSLPFEDHSFDLVYCGCVFPHIGVIGDSNQVASNFWQERLSIAKEMSRVLKPGGKVLVSSPNRWFPFDLFHGRNPMQPYPRWSPPTSRFLLSAGDYRRLFTEAGCSRFQPLPVRGYWGFIRMKESWKGRMKAFPIELVFDAVSTSALGFLRTTPVNPWLVMLMERR